MNNPATPIFDFKQAVARHFSGRPTLRQVASEQLLQLLNDELPWLAFTTPTLTSADPLTLDSPDPATPYWTTEPFVDRILKAMLASEPLDLEPLPDGRHHNVGLTAGFRFAGSETPLDTRQLSGVTAALNELVEQLPQRFCEAQLQYWNSQSDAGITRDHWMQLLLKTALLRGLPLQDLDAQEQACLRGLIGAEPNHAAVYAVRVTLGDSSLEHEQGLCNLLVCGEWDEREAVLWCAPSGIVRSFDSLSDFSSALRDELAQRYAFDRMSWARYPIEGNVFAVQTSLLLQALFDRVDTAYVHGLSDVTALEARFAKLSDIADWFISYENDTPAVSTPPGLWNTAGKNTFAWGAALVQIATYQLESDGVAALDGIESLESYTRQRLIQQMIEDYQDSRPPDDIVLDLAMAHGVPGGAATGAGGGEPLEYAGSKNLTEFAIGNLVSLNGAIITRIRLRSGGDLPEWLDADATRQLVSKVDIGAHYPLYVADTLKDPGKRAERVRKMGREWRSALLASAVTGMTDGKVKENGLQCVVDFCAGHVDMASPRVLLLPLVFRRSASSRHADKVSGMYVLYCTEPALVLLYRPLFKQDTLRQYASLDALLRHVQESEVLQNSILPWMEPAAQAVYQNGGFLEPHIAVLNQDFFTPPETPAPATLSVEFWRSDIDEKLYTANCELLVQLAEAHTVSNAENRWQTLTEGAWLLFDVATLAVSGPIASVAWLVQLMTALENDLVALEQGSAFSRSAAIVDLLLNMGMTLLHAQRPRVQPSVVDPPLDAGAFMGAAPQRGAFAELAVNPTHTDLPEGQAQAALSSRWLDFSWRGQQGFNWLPAAQKTALLGMRSSVSLAGHAPLSTGDTAGLYLVGGNHYVMLADEVYRVEHSPAGVRVVDNKANPGPWLIRADSVWRIDSSLRLSGGMNRSGTRASLASQFRKLHKAINDHDERRVAASNEFHRLGAEVVSLQAKLTALGARRESTHQAQAALPPGEESQKLQLLIDQFDARIAQWEAETVSMRKAAVQQLETAVVADTAILPLLSAMKEPKYRTELEKGGWNEILPDYEVTTRANIIRNNDFVVTELWSLSDYAGLGELQKRIEGQDLTQVRAEYQRFRQRLTLVVDMQDRVLTAFEHLDQQLADTPDDFEIVGPDGDAPRTTGELIALRKFTTVQMRFHQVLNLADLALHLDDAAGQKKLFGYRDGLAGIALRNAAEAHGELDFANLGAQDRITILQEAWDEYSAALLNSDRIRRNGGKLIEPAMLDRYRAHVEKLKLDAGRRLLEAAREQDGGQGSSTSIARSPYKASDTPQHLVRNAHGQLLFGTQVIVDGQPILEVRESFSNELLATFEQVDGQWQQREPARRPSFSTEPPPADLSLWVQSLIEESDEIKEKAEAYVKNDIKSGALVQLYDAQLEKMDQAAAVVRDGGGNDILLRALERYADALRADKKLQLTTLYTDTNYPSAEALKFLHDEGLLKVEYVERRTMQNGTAFDEYKILRLPSKRNLWAAHFHFESPDAFAEDFTVGHLKTWKQRRMSSQLAAQSGLRLHRGRLTLEQARGIIPFT